MTKKIAVVLLNLGGPDSLDSVPRYLYNLFSDPAIINLPNPWRWLLAKFISITRSAKSKEIYDKIGGKSPLLELSEQQALELAQQLANKKDIEFKLFVSMRYWHPFSDEVSQEIKAFNPDEVLLVPLYPHFSFSTTGSSIADFKSKLGNIPNKAICCYYDHPNFIRAHIELIEKTLEEALSNHQKVKLLFSAHSLPESNIKRGDPYQWQTEQSVTLIMDAFPKIPYQICYQSKVGFKKWLTPSTQEAIDQAKKESMAVIIIPISFVSDHSETLYELDILYKNYATQIKLDGYYRVPTLKTSGRFITCLADLCLKLLNTKENNIVSSAELVHKCPKQFCACINNRG